jgi:autotransporter-associated beta strand protein
MALDRNGNALLAVLGIDSNNSGTVLKYDTNGNYIATLSAGIPGASDLTLVSPQSTWTFTGGGNFGDSTNWDTQTVPNAIGASALFSSAINGGLYDVTVNNAYTVGSLLFTNTHGTTFGLVPDGVTGHGITLNNGGIGAAVNVTSDYHFIDAPLTLADFGGNTFYIAPNSTLIVGGKINESGGARSLNKAGAGALILTGANSYTGGTTVSNGLLILHAQTGAVIAAGTTVTVSNTASLELAGTVSALGSGTVNPVSIVNNSAAPAGVSVAGTNQQAGGIDGTGTTVVEAGSDLTVGHIRQGAIVIDGTAASPAMLIIAPSSPPMIATGSPIVELANSGAPFAGGSLGGAEFSPASNGIGISAATNDNLPSSGAPVPEPSAVFLMLSAACGLFGYGVSRRRRESSNRPQCRTELIPFDSGRTE